MEKLINRHRNLTILVAVLVLQLLGLAVQVKRPQDKGAALVRVWALKIVTPLEKGIVHGQDWVHDTWRNYFYLRDVRRENQELQDENARLRLEQVRLAEDAGQAQRLQALLKFKEQLVSETVAAQVIGSSGSEQSRLIYIDKGHNDGIRQDMAVITPTGIVGKVIRVFPTTAQVLEINDQSSGVGAILEKSRLQGILKGTSAGGTYLHYVMQEEKVESGEMVLTSGGDKIFPKGMPVGHVVQVSPGPDTFLNIRVKPSARLERLEEVLVVTRVVDVQPELTPQGPIRASDILAQRLPTIQPKPPEAAQGSTPAVTPTGAQPGTGPAVTGTKPATMAGAKPNPPKPATTTGTPNATGSKLKPAAQPGVVPQKPQPGATVPQPKPQAKPVAQTATETPGNRR